MPSPRASLSTSRGNHQCWSWRERYVSCLCVCLLLSLHFSMCMSCWALPTPRTHTPRSNCLVHTPLCLSCWMEATSADVCVAWLAMCATFLKGVLFQRQMILFGCRGSISYRDSHCLPVFNLRLLGWIVSLRKGSLCRHKTEILCFFLLFVKSRAQAIVIVLSDKTLHLLEMWREPTSHTIHSSVYPNTAHCLAIS